MARHGTSLRPTARTFSSGVSSGRTANAGAAIVILLCGAVSAAWALVIPIFQSPDEPAHFDYAVSIMQAHRLVRRADGTSATIATPLTQYLLKASDFRRIAGHSPMHVAPNYGSAGYYRALDAGAPRARDAQPRAGHISYIARLYPFGFYALAALVMGIVSTVTGSLTATFFAARLLCVALAMLALFFSYRTARNLGVPPWTSVALVGAIGIFPMTSEVSAYVQPDNLAFAAISAALFFATQLRRRNATPWGILPLGIAIGVLAVTKYQFFLSGAIPIAAMLALALRRRHAPASTVWRCAAAFALPAIALLCVQHWYVDGATAIAQTGPKDIGLTYVRDLAALGPAALLRYVAGSLAGAFFGCWISGICAAGYWGVVGWGDTPMVVGSFATETLLRAAISLLSLATAAIVAYGCVRNAARLLRVGLRGHRLQALWIAASDPAIDGYLIFASVIFALYVATNNVFGLSGRHWYPYVFVAFLCFVWYAPRALRVRRIAKTSAVLACALFAYSIVAAGCTLRDVTQRYYGSNSGSYVIATAEPASGTAIGATWPLQDATYLFAPSHEAFAFPRGTPVEASGSALESGGNGAAPVVMVLDESQPLAVLARQYLFGIAEATHNVAAGYSGFSSVVDTSPLAYGAHRIAAYARTAETQPFRAIAPPRVFFVTTGDGRLPAAVRALKNAPRARIALQPLTICRGAIRYEGNVARVARGTVLLVRGKLMTREAARYDTAWLLVEKRPYAARLNGRNFVALLPTNKMAAEKVAVSLYVQRFRPLAAASIGTFSLRVTPSNVMPPLRAGAPSECADPLRELAPE